LHAPKLEYVGLVAAMKSMCNEFSERQRMEIDFQSDDLPVPLPQEISLCLIRVLQEALQNAAKHSGVRHVEVQLQGTTHEIHLLVRDFGKGFDLNAALQGRGLGLTSMQERVRLLNGTVLIQSKPKGGTTIHVLVPVIAAHASQRAAG
jgi:signal transduction histidine kinase